LIFRKLIKSFHLTLFKSHTPASQLVISSFKWNTLNLNFKTNVLISVLSIPMLDSVLFYLNGTPANRKSMTHQLFLVAIVLFIKSWWCKPIQHDFFCRKALFKHFIFKMLVKSTFELNFLLKLVLNLLS